MKEKEDDFFKKIMNRSDLQMPFPDFEDEVMMMQIAKENARQQTFSRDLRLSWFFFIAGTVFGVIISLLLPTVDISIGGITAESISIVFQILFVLFVMLHLESLLTLTAHKKKAI